MPVKITEENYQNFGRCVVLENDACKVKITTEVGPRVVYFALHGKENMFLEDLERVNTFGGDLVEKTYGEGRIAYLYGGHRLWASEESVPETTYPDDRPVTVERVDGGARFTAPPEDRNEIQKSIEVILDPNEAKATVRHVIRNVSDAPKSFAPWALSVMSAGGLEIIRQPSRPTGLRANRRMSFWAYTDMADSRVYWGRDFITLRQDLGANRAIKFGMHPENAMACYLNHGQAFVKRFETKLDGTYPDFGCSFETYTNPNFLEIESLGEYKTVPAGECLTHDEQWALYPCEGRPDPRNEAEIRTFADQFLQ